MEWFILGIIILFGLFYAGKASKQQEIDDLKKELNSYMEGCSKLNNENRSIKLKNERLLRVIKCKSPFTEVASLITDIETEIYDKVIDSLRYRDRPAFRAADEVKMMRDKSKIYRVQYKEMLYKYEFLLKSFPELEKYVDDYDALKNITNCVSYSEVEENTDKASEYLSKEEWMSMSIDARNQLALDRYKEREKSNWVIGIEYEMYIDYLFRLVGFKTYNTGVKYGINDLGRDIIAVKDGMHYIVQCKNWSLKKEIHENVVCQLFGTTLEYKIQKSEQNKLIDWDKKVIPYLCTTTKLSSTAMKFADKLGVQVQVINKRDYPMIKCNIGKNGEKIYHLPFDQQYYKVQIDKEGEFYAWTVKEAVGAGFRRAYRYNSYNN